MRVLLVHKAGENNFCFARALLRFRQFAKRRDEGGHAPLCVARATTVELAGWWQYKSENNFEPSLTTIANNLYGYKTTILNAGQVLGQGTLAGQVSAAGEEVLSRPNAFPEIDAHERHQHEVADDDDVIGGMQGRRHNG